MKHCHSLEKNGSKHVLAGLSHACKRGADMANEKDLTEEEIEKRRDEVLQRMLNTPPKKHPKPKPGRRPGRPVAS